MPPRRPRPRTARGSGRSATAICTRFVVVAVLAGTLAGCAGSDSEAVPAASAARATAPPRTFALALGIDLHDAEQVHRLAGYDLVVVDGEEVTGPIVERMQAGGAQVLAYLSVGTLEPGRPWFATAKAKGWLLEHWDDWDEWYADVAAPGLRSLLGREARRELAKGVDGLFLDNTDMVQDHPGQEAGMRALVAALDRAVGSNRWLFAQNGDPAAAGLADHLDGWNREDVSFTYDFDERSYVAVAPADHASAIRQLRRLRAAGLLVTATDYVGEGEATKAARAARAACSAGALSFVSDIELTRIPSPPRPCPRR